MCLGALLINLLKLKCLKQPWLRQSRCEGQGSRHCACRAGCWWGIQGKSMTGALDVLCCWLEPRGWEMQAERVSQALGFSRRDGEP